MSIPTLRGVTISLNGHHACPPEAQSEIGANLIIKRKSSAIVFNNYSHRLHSLIDMNGYKNFCTLTSL
ncbi:Uncharacterised protein [Vibrio cholerae]|nr:Uncharacterised protein [Vibrio cholerae]